VVWDLAHLPVGGVVGCRVLVGVQDGFCGCLTTVSTWVAELAVLRKGRAYIYGTASVLVSFAMLVLIMGGLRWTHGFSLPLC
jgi:fluoride ion exporter CrcB/FEX